MQRIIFATGNAGKMKEIRAILSDLRLEGSPVEILSMKEAEIFPEIEEMETALRKMLLLRPKLLRKQHLMQ